MTWSVELYTKRVPNPEHVGFWMAERGFGLKDTYESNWSGEPSIRFEYWHPLDRPPGVIVHYGAYSDNRYLHAGAKATMSFEIAWGNMTDERAEETKALALAAAKEFDGLLVEDPQEGEVLWQCEGVKP